MIRKRSLFLSCLVAFLFLSVKVHALPVTTSTGDLGNNVIFGNADFSVALYLDTPSNTITSTLDVKHGLWNGIYAEISVYLNTKYVGLFRSENGYISPGPQYSSFDVTGFLLDGTNNNLFNVTSFYNPNPSLYYVDYVIGQVSINYDNGSANGTAPVPEPATILLLITGLIGLAGSGRNKSNK
jgi:hypothetical protein